MAFLREFDLISRLCAKIPRGQRTILGPGDDCAIIARARGQQLLTIDSMVEGVHFKLDWTTPEALGARALTVNLSDIAAMGGVPTVCVINLAIRPQLPASFFDHLYAGLGKVAATAGVGVVGGNVTRAAQLAITIAIVGDAGTGVMRRDAARVGDSVYVTGTIGDAALGLAILEGRQDARGAARKFLLARFLAPTPRLAAGRRLAALKPVPAAIDISDGLWQDLGHIIERSRVGAEIDIDAIPLSPAYRTLLGDDPQLALSGGEDYELLFCTATAFSPATLSRKLGVPVSRIGRIVKGRSAKLLKSGRSLPDLTRRLAGWDQLRDAGA
ncbi:MAG TPA: thiamine-phosphate kinase [Candidatus Binataceae bacterium]|nr:thiamine-phosphate kinase [Candidatus Binataceae bacterium]